MFFQAVHAIIDPIIQYIGQRQNSPCSKVLSAIPGVGAITYYAKMVFNQSLQKQQEANLQQIRANQTLAKELFTLSCTISMVAFFAFYLLGGFYVSAALSLAASLAIIGYQIYGIVENQRNSQEIWW